MSDRAAALDSGSARFQSALFAKQAQQRRKLEFVPAKASAAATPKPLAGSTASRDSTELSKGKAQKERDVGLFDEELVQTYHKWLKTKRIGPGFYNDGNSCYLNATVQCLLYIPSLAQLLLSEKDKLVGRRHNAPSEAPRPVLELLQNLASEVHSPDSTRALSPRGMVASIRRVGKQFKPLRQEDAHEYLRQLLDHLHEDAVKTFGLKSNDPKAETTFVYRVFGGRLVNTLACSKCSFVSRTYNSFLDLSVDCASSVQQAIANFTKPEHLTAGNEWRCDGCKEKVQATKQLAIAKAPQVLVLHLKRFAPMLYYGSKITRPVSFPLSLNLPCQVSQPSNKTTVITERYDLVGVVEHHGHSTHSGHYLAYVKASNGTWHLVDDNVVTTVSVQTVLKAQAYILFYTKHYESTPAASAPTTSRPTPAAEPPAKAAGSAPSAAEALARAAATLSSLGLTPSSSSAAALPPASGPTAATAPSAATDSPDDKEDDEGNAEDDDDERPSTRLPDLWPFIRTVRFRGYRGRLLFSRDRRRGSIPLLRMTPPESEADSSSSPSNESEDEEDVEEESMKEEPKPIASVSAVQKPSISGQGEAVDAMLAQARRGRVLGGEGVWEHVPSEIATVVEAIGTQQRRRDQHEKRARAVSQWDAMLDMGRQKKVRVQRESHDDGANPFQAVAENRQTRRP